MIPRLNLSVVAAASLWWCALVIDVARAVSGFIAATLDATPSDLLRAPVETLLNAVQSGSVGLAVLLALLYLIYGFFCLYLLMQMVVRLALSTKRTELLSAAGHGGTERGNRAADAPPSAVLVRPVPSWYAQCRPGTQGLFRQLQFTISSRSDR